MTREELCEIGDIGQITADNIVSYFATDHARRRAERFREMGLTLTAKEEKKGEALAGLTFVITGTLPSMGREEAKKLTEARHLLPFPKKPVIFFAVPMRAPSLLTLSVLAFL